MLIIIVEQIEEGWMLTDSNDEKAVYTTADKALAEIHRRMLRAEPSSESTSGQG